MMQNKNRRRKTFGYKVRLFFYSSKWKAIVKLLLEMKEEILTALALVALFIAITILPHFLH